MNKYKGFIIEPHGTFAMYIIRKEGKGTLFKKLRGMFRTPKDAMIAIDFLPKKIKKEKKNAENTNSSRD